MGSETTAAASGKVGEVRRDPFAMLPFCGYHMGDYFRHWLDMGRAVARSAADLQRQLVPQGRRGSLRVAGIRAEHARAEVDRRALRRERVGARETPLGLVPEYDDLDWSGLDFDASRFSDLMGVDLAQWERELKSHNALFDRLGEKRPGRADARARSAGGSHVA